MRYRKLKQQVSAIKKGKTALSTYTYFIYSFSKFREKELIVAGENPSGTKGLANAHIYSWPALTHMSFSPLSAGAHLHTMVERERAFSWSAHARRGV